MNQFLYLENHRKEKMTEPFINPKAGMIVIILFLLAMLFVITNCEKGETTILDNSSKQFKVVYTQTIGQAKLTVIFDNFSDRTFLVYESQHGVGICPFEYVKPVSPTKPEGLKQ
jgi:hypothetical protein